MFLRAIRQKRVEDMVTKFGAYDDLEVPYIVSKFWVQKVKVT